jgi:uncharacterized surface protein with fasciclin (FAS1) repeats
VKSLIFNYQIKLCQFLGLVILFNGCQSEVQYWDKKPKELVIVQYIESISDYSEFNEILEFTGMKSCLSTRGPFTLFLPTNKALQEYYVLKGVKSFTEFDSEFLKKLVLNHIIEKNIESNMIGLGAIEELNGIGDFIVSEFDGADIILNKNSKIIKRDILTANGVVHLINKVLDPVEKSVFELLKANKSYSIFTEGLIRTHLADTLNTIYFPYGKKTARARFTILAITDSTFYRFGIFSIEDLIARYTSDFVNISDICNEFYRYMEYHCLAETYFLNQLSTKLYPILSYDNNVLITVDNDYKINLQKDNAYTKFIIEQCNMPGKNGTVHTIDNLLHVSIPILTTIVWEVTDQFDLKQGDYYKKYYQRFFDGQNTFANIKWDGDYLLYYYKLANTGSLINNDCFSMIGWWWIEVTTPKIMKGKYKINGVNWLGGGMSNFNVFIDGVNTAYITNNLDPLTTWGEVEWTKTETHTVKLVAKSTGMLFWDAITFTPIFK